MKNKKILVMSMITLSILLCSCGNKQTNMSTEDNHNYAVNDTRDNTESTDTEIDTESDVVYNNTESNNNSSNVESNKNNETMQYTYPNDSNSGFYVNNTKVGNAIEYCFMFNDLKYSPKDDIDTIKKASIENKIFSQGYSYKLILSNASTDNTDETQIFNIEPVIDTIKIGDKTYSFNDLAYNAENIEDLIKMLASNYKIISNNKYDENNIFSCAINLGQNDLYGTTYEWKFSVEDSKLNYTKEELSILSDVLKSSTIKVTATYDIYDKINKYELSISKTPRYWYEEKTKEVKRTKTTYDENDNVVSTEVISEDTVKTGEYQKDQNGYDFSNMYIKFKDDSYLGLDNFAIVMYNPNTATNKNINVNYTNNK